MIKYIQNCAFVQYMKYDYWKAPKWLRKFYDFVAKRINLFLNWYWESKQPKIGIMQIGNEIYTENTDYYIDFLEIPNPPEYFVPFLTKVSYDYGNRIAQIGYIGQLFEK